MRQVPKGSRQPSSTDPKALANQWFERQALGETADTIALFACLNDDIRLRQAKSGGPRLVQWSAACWQAHFGERAAIFEYDGGLARAEAEDKAYIVCVRLFLSRHPPVGSGDDLCLSCRQDASQAGAILVPCADDERGVLHARCADAFRLWRIAWAMAALARLGLTGRLPCQADLAEMPARLLMSEGVGNSLQRET